MEINSLIEILSVGMVFGFGFSAIVGLLGFGIKSFVGMIANN